MLGRCACAGCTSSEVVQKPACTSGSVLLFVERESGNVWFLSRCGRARDPLLCGRTQFQSATSCELLVQAIHRVDFQKRLFHGRCRAERASSPAPQHESVERSIAARGASLTVWSCSHRFESVERIIFAASRAGAGNTRSAASAAWSLSRGFSTR